MVNQPEQVKFIEIRVDSMMTLRNQESVMFRKGKHYYEFGLVSVGENYHRLWPLEGTFEVDDEGKVVEVDLSQYRVFRLCPTIVWRSPVFFLCICLRRVRR